MDASTFHSLSTHSKGIDDLETLKMGILGYPNLTELVGAWPGMGRIMTFEESREARRKPKCKKPQPAPELDTAKVPRML